jgi:hypothetical protein
MSDEPAPTGCWVSASAPDDLRRACPGWAHHTYEVFLPKHRQGNPGGYPAHFRRNSDGTYSLLTQ